MPEDLTVEDRESPPIRKKYAPPLKGDASHHTRPAWLRRLRTAFIYKKLVPIAGALASIAFAFLSYNTFFPHYSLITLLSSLSSTTSTSLADRVAKVMGIMLLIFFVPCLFHMLAIVDETREHSERRRRYARVRGEEQKEKIKEQQIAPPRGFKLRYKLHKHVDYVNSILWSPDGQILASPSDDFTICLWNAQTGQLLHTLVEHTFCVCSVAWSPDGQRLASASEDGTIKLWNTQTGQLAQTFATNSRSYWSVAWSPDGRLLALGGAEENVIAIWDAEKIEPLHVLKKQFGTTYDLVWSPDSQILASTSGDYSIRLWSAQTGELLHTFAELTERSFSLAWSHDGKILATSSSDKTIRLWDIKHMRQMGILEGHTSDIFRISYSFDDRFLASQSDDGTVRLWRTDTLETVAILNIPFGENRKWSNALAFHPATPVLATLGEDNTSLNVWELDFDAILAAGPVTSSTQYANAKVVLVGDSGVGKSGLALALTNQVFVPTESTHGRQIWTFAHEKATLANGREEAHEVLLWDLAGQPGYRLVHQLHLNEVTVALVLFDAHSETDPLAGVYYWERALRQVQRIQGGSAPPLQKFLVAARVDRGGAGVSRARIEAVVRELGFAGYFETSAKEGRQISELRTAILTTINWEVLPRVSSTDLFQRIKSFLVSEKEAGRLLSTADDLYRAFLHSESGVTETTNLRAQFETCIGRVESRGLIRRLSFGDFILLQPELLDAYASALVNAVKDEPDGLGSIAEKRVLSGSFTIPVTERIKNKEQEQVLLIAMVEDLLRYEIALREHADDGPYLIFPSQSTRENPDLPEPEGKATVFSFEGPVMSIYATLAVRLSHSGFFQKQELWKNAVTYTARTGGTCGMFLSNNSEGRAELTLFFDQGVRQETCFHFDEYVKTHLQRRALSESIKRKRIFVCDHCGFIVPDQLVHLRLQRQANWLNCPACEQQRIYLLDWEELLKTTPASIVQEIDLTADQRRDQAVDQTSMQGKRNLGDFDVFLCHNGADKAEVKQIGELLKENGILPWLDEWELQPGLPWQPLLEEQIGKIKSAAVFVGSNGRGPWQDMELYAFLRKFIRRGQNSPVIPVILPSCQHVPEIPPFLESMTWVDFRKKEPDPLKQLIWGITGKRVL